MPKRTTLRPEAAASPAVRIRRGYFESRFGQLHVHHAIPGGGGFEEGTPLLALHPATHSGRLFTALLVTLGRDRSAFAPDLPGFGESDAPDGLSIAEQAAAIGDFLDAMRLRHVDLLGCGLGTCVALELAATRPAVRRLVIAALAASELPPPPQSADEADAYLRAAWAGARRDCGADATLARVIAACSERLRNAAHAAGAGQDYPLRERLSGICQPLLVLHAPDWPHEAGVAAADLPAHARRTPCRDLSQLQNAPQPVVAAIQDFLIA